ncbi:MAG: hydantoinase/oxoprolinase family protein, partial [Deltaproteobacteria bacterium]
MSILLGIDTGGTYTDAVLVEQKSGNVLAEAKALTTRDDLSRGITGAIDAVFKKMVTGTNPLGSEDVAMVGLSTTLATNAIAEGYGARVCLLLIGYDQDLMLRQGFNRE